MERKSSLRVAIVCDSLDQYGGAEKVVLAIHELFPDAPLYTSFVNEEKMKKHGFPLHSITVISPVFSKNRLLLKFAKQLFFIYPIIFENFDFSNYDLVISSSTRFAHAVIVPEHTMHICYIHSPSRYVWDYFSYKKNLKLKGLTKLIFPFITSSLRIWDRVAADRVDYFIANSVYTQKRVRKFYRKESTVINPFVDIHRFSGIKPEQSQREYFLYLGRFIPWRKLEYMIASFNKSGLSLRLVGNGDPAYITKLKHMAKPNIAFYQGQTDDEVIHHLAGCKAMVWPGVEDFGIAPIEALAAGKPVIALKQGGTMDVLTDGVTGIFYPEQTEQSLSAAIDKFRKLTFAPELCREKAAHFTKERFKREILTYITQHCS